MEKECILCGAPLVDSHESLHVWQEDYACGTILWGPIDGSMDYEFRARCKE